MSFCSLRSLAFAAEDEKQDEIQKVKVLCVSSLSVRVGKQGWLVQVGELQFCREILGRTSQVSALCSLRGLNTQPAAAFISSGRNLLYRS